MAEDQLQLQRFELKYRIREDVARAVRSFVGSHLVADEFAAGRKNLCYPIHSLYLDSDRLTLYWNTINGNKNRFKLRLRYYDNRPETPVFFEIKRRVNEAILKQRGAVRRDAVDLLLSGHLPERQHLTSAEPHQLVAVQQFTRLMQELEAKPKAHIAYWREAWVSARNNSVRVTLDRQVLFEPDSTAQITTELLNPVVVFGSDVILELKFTGRFPLWFGELVRVFGLRQGPAAKYADGIAMIGEDQVRFPPLYARVPALGKGIPAKSQNRALPPPAIPAELHPPSSQALQA